MDLNKLLAFLLVAATFTLGVAGANKALDLVERIRGDHAQVLVIRRCEDGTPVNPTAV